jgi:hypothetical protein
MMGSEGVADMRHLFLAIALAAVSSTAEARITDFLCTSDDGQKQWAISTDDEHARATVTYQNSAFEHSAVFTPGDVRIKLDDVYHFTISRTTLRFAAGDSETVTVRGTCRIITQATRKF